MAIHQTNRATGLLLALPDDGRPLHEQLTSSIKSAIAAGRLAPGQLLPPSRALAAELGCSRWVVNEAYVQLTAEGHLSSRQGSGTRVAQGGSAATPATHVGPETDPALDGMAIDLRPGTPDVANLPATAWIRASQRVLRDPNLTRSIYPPAAGAPALRRVLAGYLTRVRGIPVEPDEVFITCGTAHGTAVLARVLVARGQTGLAVEDPSWQRLSQVAAAAGMTIAPVPVDAGGIDVDAVKRAGARAVLCAPAHQFPVGVVLSAARRRALLTWAVREDGLVLEDDYDAEFRYDRRPVGALAGLDRTRVAYLGSASKTVHPGLRLGWLVPPPHLRAAVLAALDTGAAGPSSLDQLAFATLVDDGAYDRHLRRTRISYRARRDALVAALRERGVVRAAEPIPGVAAGLHLIVPLPSDVDDRAVTTALARRGIAAMPLSAYTIRPRPPGLVLGYGRLPVHRTDFVVERLASAIVDG